MKHLLHLAILLFFCKMGYSQLTVDTIYLNSNWEKSNKIDYTYYRILINENIGIYDCKDFWKTGEIQMSGKFSSLYPETREGLFIWYNKNGKKRQSIKYNNNKICGKIQIFSLEGNLDFEYIFSIDSLDNANDFYSAVNNFRIHLAKKTKYPKKARMDGTYGSVKTRFYIDNYGHITRLEILKSVNKELDNEAKRVIELYDKWPIPIYKGTSTFYEIIAPVNFLLK